MRFLYAQPLRILMAVVAVVLLIACANVATLLLARASARRQEFLTRSALGASRARLLRQVLTESVQLSLMGGVAGTIFAWWSVPLIIRLLHWNPVVKVRPDATILAFTLVISIVTGILFGVIPAVRYGRIGISRFASTHALTVFQVAASFVLLLGAGLLAHSLFDMKRQDLGFKPEKVLLIKTDPRLAEYKPNELFPLYRQFDDRLNAIPGVISASLARYSPVSGTSSSHNFSIQGYSAPSSKEMKVYGVEVGPRFFETLGIPLLLGRPLGVRDTPASSAVAIVSESFVKTYLPNENPLGRRFIFGSPFKAPGIEIVGVAGDSKYYDLREKAKPMAFVSAWQPQGGSPVYAGELVVRISREASGVTSDVRRVLKEINGKLPVLNVLTLDRQIDDSLYQQKMITSLSSLFGVVALILTSIGIYGTVAYSVARRATEIGIRMAVGAQRRTVLWMVLRDSIVLIAVGLLLGLPMALGGMRWIKSFLFGVETADPLALAAAAFLIVILALLAAYLPAQRATKIDPMLALRHE
jgi:predicted permease